ncbi:ATP-binding protein [Sulfidibacter corallicola]|uniref:ATP-binding protein n=1 Tax=Sulfidibacter corallicola TaxID=2818388 RepID=A0A8A4THU6_SULCO|nr:ATP-binding protein [Sulfidibacter corallicola]QTD49130.1 ATP-binding protein [Sulfidibacter corallicola]
MKKASFGSAEGLQKFQEYCEERARQAREAREAAERTSPAAKRCPLCKGKGYTWKEIDGYRHVVRCVCQKRLIARKALREAGVPEKFWDTTLFDPAEDDRDPFRPYGGPGRDPVAIGSQKHALSVCRELRDLYLEAFLHHKQMKDMYGLMLFGDSGRGKTRLICSLLSDLIHAGLHSVRFIEYNELFKLIRFSFNNKQISYKGIFDNLLRAKILVIDDLGTELGGDLTWALDNIGYIINERYTASLPTLFTSNYWESIPNQTNRRGRPTGSENDKKLFEGNSWDMKRTLERQNADSASSGKQKNLEERVSYRLRSRIREMCLEVHVEGFDYRNRIAKNRDLLRQKEQWKNEKSGGS